jgi:hypothetical protein
MTTPTATHFVPYHAVADVIQRGPRADRPAADAVVPGTLYCSTDEPLQIERSSGTVWEPVTRRRHAAIYPFDFSNLTTEPPTSNQVRINAPAPYTAATKLWIRLIGNEGRDLYWGLITIDPGALVLVQDRNDHTIAVSFQLTGPAVDKTTYIEWPVVFVGEVGAALFNNQAVLVVKR